jgi:hypothetical protein
MVDCAHSPIAVEKEERSSGTWQAAQKSITAGSPFAIKQNMPRSQWLLTMSFAAGILLSDQIHRLSLLSKSSKSRHRRLNELEFLPIELVRLMTNQTIDIEEDDETSSNGKTDPPSTFNNSHKFSWSLPPVPPNQKSSKQFMDEINALKKSKGIPLPWETSSPLPIPIISYNLPKSATLTTKEYFACGGIVSSHTFLPFSDIRIGDCMRDNFVADRDPFEGCSIHPKSNRTVEFYSDIGIQHGRSGKACWYSSLHDGGLEHVARYYPNATIFMVPRSPSKWYESVRKWGNGRLFHGWKKRCGFSGSAGNYSKADWEDFYHAHTEKIRQFALNNLHITYVEVALEEANSGETMEYYTGIDKSCLQHCFPGKPKDPNVDMKTYQKCKPVSVPS